MGNLAVAATTPGSGRLQCSTLTESAQILIFSSMKIARVQGFKIVSVINERLFAKL